MEFIENLYHRSEQIWLSVSLLGVLGLSWYPPGLGDDNGEPTEDLVSSVLDAAHRHNMKVKCQ